MTELDEAMKSLNTARGLVEGLPDPESNINNALTKATEVVEELWKIKKELNDLEAKILQPLNRAQRRASEKKILKLANKFESKSQQRAKTQTVSQK